MAALRRTQSRRAPGGRGGHLTSGDLRARLARKVDLHCSKMGGFTQIAAVRGMTRDWDMFQFDGRVRAVTRNWDIFQSGGGRVSGHGGSAREARALPARAKARGPL